MRYHQIDSLDDLEQGSYGVWEPIADRCPRWDTFERSLCVVPGLCFGEDGSRLGYGGGYYDRFLSNYSGATVGLVYDGAVRPTIPHDKLDRPVEWLVTETMIHCAMV